MSTPSFEPGDYFTLIDHLYDHPIDRATSAIMHTLLLAALIPTVLSQHLILNLDCTDYPRPCNNDCYAVYSANKEDVLKYHAPIVQKTITNFRM